MFYNFELIDIFFEFTGRGTRTVPPSTTELCSRGGTVRVAHPVEVRFFQKSRYECYLSCLFNFSSHFLDIFCRTFVVQKSRTEMSRKVRQEKLKRHDKNISNEIVNFEAILFQKS